MPLFAWRYNKFDVSKHEWPAALESLMLVVIGAMQGHLWGPERTGDMEREQHGDRFGMRLGPCGSGQRTIRDDSIEGTPPRMAPPYNFGVWPAEQWGHPIPSR